MSGNYNTGERSRELLAEIRKQIEKTDWTTPENLAALAQQRDPAFRARREFERREQRREIDRQRRRRKRLVEMLAALPDAEQRDWLLEQRALRATNTPRLVKR
jgi:hypothetical protein